MAVRPHRGQRREPRSQRLVLPTSPVTACPEFRLRHRVGLHPTPRLFLGPQALKPEGCGAYGALERIRIDTDHIRRA